MNKLVHIKARLKQLTANTDQMLSSADYRHSNKDTLCRLNWSELHHWSAFRSLRRDGSPPGTETEREREKREGKEGICIQLALWHPDLSVSHSSSLIGSTCICLVVVATLKSDSVYSAQSSSGWRSNLFSHTPHTPLSPTRGSNLHPNIKDKCEG